MRTDTTNFFNETEVKSDTKPEQYFSVPPEAFSHIMDMLSSVYPDILTAVLREYVTNAYDATKEAGSNKTVEVRIDENDPFITLQGEHKSYATFEVKDNGTGMDYDDLVNTYIRYGISPKRNKNKFSGGFGIGAKAVFGLTDYFEITTVKNGRKLETYFTKEKTGGARFDVHSDTTTTEPNGVTVRIPLSRGQAQEMLALSDKMFYTWPLGSYTINKEIPAKQKQLWDETEFLPVYDEFSEQPLAWFSLSKISDPLQNYQPMTYKKEKDYYAGYRRPPFSKFDKITYVMGGAPYKIETSTSYDLEGTQSLALNDVHNNHHIVWNVPVGYVTITPDRTSIKQEDDNLLKLRSYRNKVWELLRETSQQVLNGLTAKEQLEWLSSNHALCLPTSKVPLHVNQEPVIDKFVFADVYPETPVYVVHKGTRKPATKYYDFSRLKTIANNHAHPTYKSINDRGDAVNLLLWGKVDENFNPKVYSDIYQAVNDVKDRYIKNDSILCVHVETDEKPDADFFQNWLIMNINDVTEHRRSYARKTAKFRERTTAPVVTFQTAQGGLKFNIKALTGKELSELDNVIYVQEQTVTAKREWSKYFAEKEKNSYSSPPWDMPRYSKFFDETYTIVYLTGMTSAMKLLKYNPDAQNFVDVLNQKLEKYDRNLVSAVSLVKSRLHNVLYLWKVNPAEDDEKAPVRLKHPVLVEAVQTVKEAKELSQIADFVASMHHNKDEATQQLLSKFAKTPLTKAAQEILSSFHNYNGTYFNKLMELYPNV